MKRIIYISGLAFFIFCTISLPWAKGMVLGNMRLAQAQEENVILGARGAVEVGNKICPVSGEKIEEKAKAAYEYEGKVYNFCCEMCIEEFKKEPQKYIDKVEEELQTKPKEEASEEKKIMPES